MKYLITGGCGFLGTNLACDLIQKNASVSLLDNLSRKGTEENLNWLKTKGAFTFDRMHIQNAEGVAAHIKVLQPEVIFHLAGQVAMTTSIENPRLDFETNVVGTINVLEAVRKFSPHSIVVYSSTNKVYGDFEWVPFKESALRYEAPDFPKGFSENTPLDFRSPYGCSKGAADQYMLDYARIWGLKTVVLRHSSIFGDRQFSTYDQGWIGWFVRKAIEASKGNKTPFTISGDGKQVRDILFSSDLVNCYNEVVTHIEKTKGEAFNIGGGIENSRSLLELFRFLEKELSTKLFYEKLPWRKSDQKVFIANITKAKDRMQWTPSVSADEGLKKMIHWVSAHV